MMIEIKNLRFSYQGNKKSALKDISLDIEEGEILAVFGESGSGKSTLLRLIAGLESKGEGLIKIAGERVLDAACYISPEKRGLGMVFQDYALFPHMTVKKNIAFGLLGINHKEREKRVSAMLDLVNLKEYGDKFPHELSGGQQQRVALARALAPSPKCLLLDEPFSNLDSELQDRIRDELKSIIVKTGVTTIFVTHDREDVRRLADKVAVLKDGELVKYGTVEEILAA